jgi:hypothetical protein
MSKTISFVAKDELAEWLEERAEERMKSISAVCQDIVAAEYRRERERETAKPDQSGDDGGLLGEARRIDFPSKQAADAFRGEYSQFVDDERDDLRTTGVSVIEDTPVKYLPNSEV